MRYVFIDFGCTTIVCSTVDSGGNEISRIQSFQMFSMGKDNDDEGLEFDENTSEEDEIEDDGDDGNPWSECEESDHDDVDSDMDETALYKALSPEIRRRTKNMPDYTHDVWHVKNIEVLPDKAAIVIPLNGRKSIDRTYIEAHMKDNNMDVDVTDCLNFQFDVEKDLENNHHCKKLEVTEIYYQNKVGVKKMGSINALFDYRPPVIAIKRELRERKMSKKDKKRQRKEKKRQKGVKNKR